jgi:hypothetical protein
VNSVTGALFRQITFVGHSKTNLMSLFTVLLVIIVAGFVLWLVNKMIPMDRKIKKILNIVVVVAVIFWLLKVFHFFDFLMSIQV